MKRFSVMNHKIINLLLVPGCTMTGLSKKKTTKKIVLDIIYELHVLRIGMYHQRPKRWFFNWRWILKIEIMFIQEKTEQSLPCVWRATHKIVVYIIKKRVINLVCFSSQVEWRWDILKSYRVKGFIVQGFDIYAVCEQWEAGMVLQQLDTKENLMTLLLIYCASPRT